MADCMAISNTHAMFLLLQPS